MTPTSSSKRDLLELSLVLLGSGSTRARLRQAEKWDWRSISSKRSRLIGTFSYFIRNISSEQENQSEFSGRMESWRGTGR